MYFFRFVISFVVVCSLLLGKSSNAQKYNFRQYSLEEGLSQSQVFDIEPDDMGNMWIATYGGGITVYNGIHSWYYSVEENLPGYSVLSLHNDGKGKMWIGTNMGLAAYNGDSIIRFDGKNGLRVPIWEIDQSSDGVIWLAGNNGLWFYKNDSLQLFKHDSLKSTQIYNLFIDSSDRMWLFTSDERLVMYDGKNIHKNLIDETLIVNTVFEDHKNQIWLGLNQGLMNYSDNQKLYTKADGLSDNHVLDIEQDNNMRLWIGTDIGGVNVFDGKNFMTIWDQQGIGFNRVNKLYEDNNHNLWIGTDGAGVSIFSGFTFQQISFANGGVNNFVMAVIAEKDEQWFGTDGMGLVRRKNGKIKIFNTEDGLASNSINAICKGLDDTLWIATNYGLCSFDGANFKTYTIHDGLPENYTMSLLLASDSTLYIGTYGSGAAKYKNGKIEDITEELKLEDDIIWNIYEDSRGSIYFTTGDGYVKHGTKTKRHTTDNGLIDNGVGSIVEDSKGVLWVGTDNGISRFDGKKYRNYQMKDGLCSNIIYLLTIDKDDNLIVGTEKGINRIQYDESGNFTQVKYYGKKEGFFGIECNSNAVDIDENGKIWIGTVEGVTIFDPKEENTCINPPKSYITKIKLYYNEVNWKQYTDSVIPWIKLPHELELQFNQNNLTFEFIGIDYIIPENVQYKYRLKGIEEEWSPPTSSNYVRYTNIPPGDYEFQVIASNHYGIWNKKPTGFLFVINAPFWKTIWFYTLIALAVITGIFFYIRFRTRKLKKAKDTLALMVKERTFEVLKQKDEIEQKNIRLEEAYKDITDSLRYARRIQEAMLPPVEKISKYFSDLFILYKPKDIVSGDFYWYFKHNKTQYLAAVDCTGHGVPAGFLSMVGSNLLSQITESKDNITPSEILTSLDQEIIRFLHQKGDGDSSDGMDMALCSIDHNNILTFAGAMRPLYKISNQELTVYKGTKVSIGGAQRFEKVYVDNEIPYKEGDMIYIFSDGYQDQMGGEFGKKMMIKRFKKVLLEVADKTHEEQHKKLDDYFQNWKQNEEQIDDILVIGFRM